MQKSNVIYDYLIVGAGLFGSVFAFEASKRGKKCLVVDKRSHIGGNCYTESFVDSSVDLSKSSANSNLDFSANPQNANPNAKSTLDSNAPFENKPKINIHKYGAHIFHTSNAKIWQYIQQFCEFNHFINSPLANFRGEIYNLPFNMNTFAQIFGNASKLRHATRERERERELPTR
ncbi:NAD(P)-binding protein [Helicobacter sp. T3_23-1059]